MYSSASLDQINICNSLGQETKFHTHTNQLVKLQLEGKRFWTEWWQTSIPQFNVLLICECGTDLLWSLSSNPDILNILLPVFMVRYFHAFWPCDKNAYVTFCTYISLLVTVQSTGCAFLHSTVFMFVLTDRFLWLTESVIYPVMKLSGFLRTLVLWFFLVISGNVETFI